MIDYFHLNMDAEQLLNLASPRLDRLSSWSRGMCRSKLSVIVLPPTHLP